MGLHMILKILFQREDEWNHIQEILKIQNDPVHQLQALNLQDLKWAKIPPEH